MVIPCAELVCDGAEVQTRLKAVGFVGPSSERPAVSCDQCCGCSAFKMRAKKKKKISKAMADRPNQFNLPIIYKVVGRIRKW